MAEEKTNVMRILDQKKISYTPHTYPCSGGAVDGATVAGLITSLTQKRNKKGELYAIATIEDLDGAVEVFFFAKTWMTVHTMLGTDVVCVVKGRVNKRDESVSLYASDVTLPDLTDGPRGPVVLQMDTMRATTGRIGELDEVLRNHPGVTEVQLRLRQPGRSTTLRLQRRVTAS